jgi:hypothetical protein
MPDWCSRTASTAYWGVALWMHTSDADMLYVKLHSAGVRILAEPTRGNFRRQFTFADEDGYAVVAHDGRSYKRRHETFGCD